MLIIKNMERQVVEVSGILCEVIATYSDEKTKKNYVIYTDKTKNQGKLNVYFGLYEIVQDKFVVKKITSEEDKQIVSDMFKEILNTI